MDDRHEPLVSKELFQRAQKALGGEFRQTSGYVAHDNLLRKKGILAELIRQMKAEIAEAKELTTQGKLGEAMALANEKKPRGVKKIEK